MVDRKERPKVQETVSGCCIRCWHLCLRANTVSCTKVGVPTNNQECRDFRVAHKMCPQCGYRLLFEEMVLPNPYKKDGPGFPSGRYFCDQCGQIVRSTKSDSRYAEWVESLVLQRQKTLYKKVSLKGDV